MLSPFILMEEGDKEYVGLSLAGVPLPMDCGQFCNITFFGFTVFEHCHRYGAPPATCLSTLEQPEYLGL